LSTQYVHVVLTGQHSSQVSGT